MHSFDEGIRWDMLNSTSLMNRLPHRRIWDLYANWVVPLWVPTLIEPPWAILHAWVSDKNLKCERTPINGYKWPMLMLKDADLNLIRIEMLSLGAEYVWLDVLCWGRAGARIHLFLSATRSGKLMYQWLDGCISMPLKLHATLVAWVSCWVSNHIATFRMISVGSIGIDTTVD